VNVYSGPEAAEKAATGVLSVVGPKTTLFRIVNRWKNLVRGEQVRVVGVLRESLISFDSAVDRFMPDAGVLAVPLPSTVSMRMLRQNVRVKVGCACAFRPFQMRPGVGAFPQQPGIVVDISKGGMLISSESPPASDYLLVAVRHPAEPELEADVRVLRLSQASNGAYEVAVKFVIIDAQSLESLSLFMAMQSVKQSGKEW